MRIGIATAFGHKIGRHQPESQCDQGRNNQEVIQVADAWNEVRDEVKGEQRIGYGQ